MATETKLKLRVLELRAEGTSFARIAKECKIAKQTAVDIVRDNLEEVSTLQAIEMEAFFTERKINAKGRIEQLSALHARLLDEIDRRDLSEVPTDKLINLYIKTSETLRGEVFTPEVSSTQEQKHDNWQRSLNTW